MGLMVEEVAEVDGYPGKTTTVNNGKTKCLHCSLSVLNYQLSKSLETLTIQIRPLPPASQVPMFARAPANARRSRFECSTSSYLSFLHPS